MSSDMESGRREVTAVVTEIRLLSAEIDRLDQHAADQFGVNRTDLRAIEALSNARSLSPTALADKLGFTTGGVTTVIDRLERAGYVRRVPDLSDRRRLVVEATEHLAEREQAIFGGLLRALPELVSTFSTAELGVIATFLMQLRSLLAQRSPNA